MRILIFFTTVFCVFILVGCQKHDKTVKPIISHDLSVPFEDYHYKKSLSEEEAESLYTLAYKKSIVLDMKRVEKSWMNRDGELTLWNEKEFVITGTIEESEILIKEIDYLSDLEVTYFLTHDYYYLQKRSNNTIIKECKDERSKYPYNADIEDLKLDVMHLLWERIGNLKAIELDNGDVIIEYQFQSEMVIVNRVIINQNHEIIYLVYGAIEETFEYQVENYFKYGQIKITPPENYEIFEIGNCRSI